MEGHTACTNSTNCVHISHYGVTDTFVIRDSKDPGGAELEFTREEFTNFIQAVKNGEFDKIL